MNGSDTTPKQQGGVTGKGFVKGDPRINRNGRPRVSDELRDLILDVLAEKAKTKDGGAVVIDGHAATNIEVIVRRMITDPKQFTTLLERAYGKVTQPVNLSQDTPLEVTTRIVRRKADDANA